LLVSLSICNCNNKNNTPLDLLSKGIKKRHDVSSASLRQNSVMVMASMFGFAQLKATLLDHKIGVELGGPRGGAQLIPPPPEHIHIQNIVALASPPTTYNTTPHHNNDAIDDEKS
jgi:hypothetical protein